MLGNLDPSLMSRLENIHLVALLLEKYSYDCILAPFVSDLKILSTVHIKLLTHAQRGLQ